MVSGEQTAAPVHGFQILSVNLLIIMSKILFELGESPSADWYEEHPSQNRDIRIQVKRRIGIFFRDFNSKILAKIFSPGVNRLGEFF
jgi:hypothetical protein